MILPDDTPESPTKSRAGPPSEVPDEEFVAPPPAYPGHGSRRPDIEAHAGSSSEPLLQPQHHVEQVEPATQRFLKAFGIAALIWIVFGSFARSIYSLSHSREHPYLPGRGRGSLPRIDDGIVKRCIVGSSLVQAKNVHVGKTVSFRLPLSADVLYIFGRGSLSQGAVTLTSTKSSSLPRDIVEINITPTYESARQLGLVNLCHLERAPGAVGIGILTPDHVSPEGLLGFAVDVRFPAIGDGGILQVKAFETKLPLFSHTLKRLEDKVRFESISLESQHMYIHSDYLSADVANIITSNAKLSGTFHATQELFLKTSNADISADVTLYHDHSTPSYTNLTMLNANAVIDTRVALYSTSLSSTGGSYDVLAHTSNARLDVRVPIQPRDSKLALDARTSNSPAYVHLSPTYEGSCHVETKLARPEAECDEHAVDPTGRGRRRVCALPRTGPQTIEGWAAWGPAGPPHGPGEVRVVTSNGAAKLLL